MAKIGKGYKGPQPSTSRLKNPKRFVHGLDPVSAAKKFLMYKNVFGNMGGPPAGLSPQGSPTGTGGGLGGAASGPKGGPGNIGLMVAGRRMGMI